MFWDDHPPAHFHAIYGEHRAQILIATGEVMSGALPPKERRLVRKWTELHREELLEDWRKAQEGLPLDRIDPLP